MRDYIEREAALESVREKLRISESLPDCIPKRASVFTLASMNDSLKSIPAADVRPVVRGKWIKNGWSIRCSECGHDMPFSVRNFCPNCGADMRGGEDNGQV